MAVEHYPYQPLLGPRTRVNVKRLAACVTHDNLPLSKARVWLEEERSPIVELRRGWTGEATGVRSASGSAKEAPRPWVGSEEPNQKQRLWPV